MILTLPVNNIAVTLNSIMHSTLVNLLNPTVSICRVRIRVVFIVLMSTLWISASPGFSGAYGYVFS
jgi:hypothetical protein